MDNQLEKIEQVLDFMSCKQFGKYGTPRKYRLPLSYFREVMPLQSSFTGCGDNHEYMVDVPLSELGNKLDVSLLSIRDDVNKSKAEFSETDSFPVVTHRIRTVDARLLRGKLNKYSPFIIEHSFAGIHPLEGEYGTGTVYWGCKFKDGLINHMEFIGPPQRLEPGMDDFEQAWVLTGTSIAIAFERRYQWRVLVGVRNGAQLSFVSNPVGIRDIFKLRDIPEGKSRRTALRNWVREHYRDKKDGDFTKVRQHLRGATEFTCGEFIVKVIPAPYEQEINERLAIEREIEKLRGENKQLMERPKVRWLTNG